MKKAIKIIVCAIVVVIVFVVALIATLPLWLGPVVKPTANSMVPKFTKTDFHLGVLKLNPYNGKFELGDMQLANPSNFGEKYAATVGRIFVDVAMDTLGDKYIHIEEVAVEDVFVSYVSADGVNNFKQIQYNLAGGKEAYEEKQARSKADGEKAEADAAKAEAAKSAEQKEREVAEAELKELNKKKVVIDKLTISGLKVKLGFMPIALPPITLTDLGKESDGITFAELGEQILAAVMKSIGAIGDGVKALGGLLGDGASAVGDGAGKALDAVGDGAGKALDAVGDGAGKALDAVGEGAGKAVDALKGLFN